MIGDTIMIKGLPQLFVKRNGGVFVDYKFVVDDNFEQKERTLRKSIYKLSLNIKEKRYKIANPLKKINVKTAWPISKTKDYCKIYTLKEESHNAPSFKFIRQIDCEAKTNPDHFY